MYADIAVVVSMMLVMAVIVAKLLTSHLLAAAKAELFKLAQEKEGVVEKLKTVTERRISAQDNRDFVERRKDEQLLRRDRLVYELEEVSQMWRQAAHPGLAPGAEQEPPEQQGPAESEGPR